MLLKKRNKAFVSDEDKFLRTFDQKHSALSSSQQAEIAKARRIEALRDQQQPITTAQPIWEDF